MEIINCQNNHERTCYLKTGATIGSPQYGKSYYICPLYPKECQFKKSTNVPSSVCLKHSEEICELQVIKQNSLTKEWTHYYRCKTGQNAINGSKWCGSQLWNSDTKCDNLSSSSTNKLAQGGYNVNAVINEDNKATCSQLSPSELKEKLKGKFQAITTGKPATANIDTVKTTLKKQYKLFNQIDIQALPDRGEKIKQNIDELEMQLKKLEMGHSSNPGAIPKRFPIKDPTKQCLQSMHFPKHESSVVKTESQKYTGATYFKQDSSVMKNGTQKYTGATYSKQDSSEMKNEIPKYKGATYSKQDSSVIKNEVPKYTGASYFKQDSSVMKNETQKYTGATYSKQDSSEMKNEIPKYTGATYSKQDSSVMKNDTQKYTGATYPCSVIAPAKLYILKDENRVMPIDLESAKNVSNFPQNMVQYQNVQQYYGGRMTHQRLLEVRSATEAALVSLHKALQTCPALEEEELDPEGLKTKLKPHQKKGLKWLLWRENHVPRGGILADDMGLGKTLTMLALILKDIESNLQSVEDNGVINAKTTLVICPVSLIYQWENEAMKHCVMKAFPGDILLYHGQNREINSKRLATYSIVITSYNIIQREVGPPKVEADQKIKDIWGQPAAKSESSGNTSSPLLKIVWNRIILDEGHTIKNPKSNTALAVCRLRAKNRWVVTGMPIHNKLSDLYSLLRFLRYSPFDEHQVWKNWMESDTSTGRLNKLVKSILLIRNKNHIDENGIPIVELPTKSIEIHKLSLEGKEKEIYDKIQSYSKSALQCLLDKKEEVQNENTKLALSSNGPKRTLNAATLLALLTRMQQCCSHLSLLKPMLDGSPDPEPVDELDAILNQLSNLNIKDDAATTSNIYAGIDMSVYKNDKDFKIEASSLKIGTVLREVQNIRDSKKGDKCVIVSQWTSLLDIMGFHLKKGDIKYDVIQGNVKLEERNRVMQHFNKNPKGPMVVLLSLRAGGVGINLTGGNHLFLLDNHWNPALENQACDRIYRMGQTKEVKIHKFVCKDTIEERVMELQKQKLHLASKVLEGNADKNNQKLSLQDLKALFGMN